MIGRGALALPNLALCIKNAVAPMPWSELASLLIQYSGYEIFGDKGKYYPNRIKQWCGYLKRQYPEAELLFNDIRRLTNSQDIVDVLARQASS
jgi:tRNA-dihydrouridine synthase C